MLAFTPLAVARASSVATTGGGIAVSIPIEVAVVPIAAAAAAAAAATTVRWLVRETSRVGMSRAVARGAGWSPSIGSRTGVVVITIRTKLVAVTE